MEFHPVILAAGRGSRMYPLTEHFPKALLPVGNMPLIWYPIQLLEKNGFNGTVQLFKLNNVGSAVCSGSPEALVIVRDSEHHAISEALERLQIRHAVHLKFILCDIPDQEDWGTADSLRHICSKVKVRIPVLDLLHTCTLTPAVPSVSARVPCFPLLIIHQ